MTKIFHWVFGSFFRTLGRILGYLIIGVILALILSNAKLPKVSDIFTDIFFMKVDALTYDGTVSRLIQVWNNDQTIYLETQKGSNNYNELYKTFTYSFNSNEDDFITFPIVGGVYNYIEYQGNNEANYYIANNVIFQVSLLSNNGGNNKVCEIQNNLLVCPMNKNATYTMLQFKTYNSEAYTHSSWDINLSIGAYPTLYKTISNQQIQNDNNNTQAIINNQNQNNQAIINNQNQNNQAIINNQNQNNQAINNTITDESAPSNLSNLSNNNMVGWLPPGPVDSLINLPLVLLNSLQNSLSSTCSPVTLTLPFVNSDIILPCMSTLYQSMGVSGFVNWAGIVASAFILFSYLLRFYKWVDNTLTFRENNWLDNWGGE